MGSDTVLAESGCAGSACVHAGARARLRGCLAVQAAGLCVLNGTG